MTDDTNQPITTHEFGHRLKAARESLQFSQKEAADRLHLSPNVIDLMEKGNFENTLPITFLRGYLRSYARLLNFKEEDINIALEQLGLKPATSTMTPLFIGNITHKEQRYTQWLTYLIILVLFVLVGMWWNTHSRTIAIDQLTTSTTSPKKFSLPKATPEKASELPINTEQSIHPLNTNISVVTPLASGQLRDINHIATALPEPGLN